MATSARYTRRFPPALDLSSYLGQSNDHVFNDCHMPEPQLFNQGKRQRPEQRPPQLSETSQPVSKKRKVSHPSGCEPPAAFWDNLSKIWLTRSALRELDRRNAQSAPNPPWSSYRRPHRPLTRRGLAEWKKLHQPTQSVIDFPSHNKPRRLKDIQLLARHGGPDLSDLRGVCIARSSLHQR
jgi:hypothetical protein